MDSFPLLASISAHGQYRITVLSFNRSFTIPLETQFVYIVMSINDGGDYLTTGEGFIGTSDGRYVIRAINQQTRTSVGSSSAQHAIIAINITNRKYTLNASEGTIILFSK